MDDFRAHFPVFNLWAFLDCAAVAALPDVAVKAFHDYAALLSGNGIACYLDWADRVRSIRTLAARLVNAPSADDICFVPSTTFGIGLVAEGFPWQSGDNVVVPAEEFPSNIYPWLNLKSRGVETRLIPSRGPRVQIDDIRNAMDSRTRVLAISAVEFASGYRSDLAALGELCRSRGIFFFVDAIQRLGMMPLDVQSLGIDALSADSHKWLLGPEGAGLAYIRREWAERFRTVMVGFNSTVNAFDYNQLDFLQKPHAGRWEGGGYNTAGIFAMGSSLQLLLDAGLGKVWSRIEALSDELCEKARSQALEVFSSRDASEKSGIVMLTKPGHDPAVLLKRCRDAGVIVANRRDRLRVSTHAYNNSDDLDRFLDAVK
jgi:cysteine desulfurase / selenocysteine lyase